MITQQDRFSALVEAKLSAEIVQKDGLVWNNDYEGDPKAGAVKVPVRGKATVASYNKANGVSRTYAEGSYDTILINKDYAVNEVIDGYDADAVPDNVIANRLDAAGEALAEQVNSDGTEELLDKATVNGQTAATTSSNIYARLVDISTAMDKAHVPMSNRWCLLNPDCKNMVLKSSEFISASNLGDEVKQYGAIGSIAGFLILVDATLPDNAIAICGHKNWCCRVNEWAVPVRLQSLEGSGTYIGASAVQGRKAYGHKVTNSAAVNMLSAVLNCTITEATATGTTTITITAGTNATKVKYRVGTVSDSVTTWGSWTDYNAESKPTAEATNIVEAYGLDAKGVRSGIVSHTVTAS